jgi:gamma-glutamylputrescine oxidase
MNMLEPDDRLTRGSYYEAGVSRPRRHAPLQGEVACDVCVVGGGLAGLSAAIELRGAGFTVAVLESRAFGWGASGRNGGQALAGLACDMSVVERQLGREAARRIWDLSVEAVGLIAERCRIFGIDCEWQPGFLSVAIGARRAAQLQRWAESLERDYGYGQLRGIARAELAQWIASARYHGAVYDGGGGHLHPLKYTLGLARAAAGIGAALYEDSAAIGLEPGPTCTVRTARGLVHCKYVLLAGNVYLDPLVPRLARRIMPVGTFIAASAPLAPALAASLIPSRAAVCDTQWVLDYFRLSRDDRMVFGGRVSYSGLVPQRLPESMRQRMVGVFPQLADTPVEYAWGGFVDITMNRAPDFGRLAPNVYYLQGFSGHGLALTGMAGRFVAQAIAGSAAKFDLFAKLTHRDFPGGSALRTPLLVLAMAWFRLRDLLG